MSFLKKMIGFFAVLAVMSPAFSAASRVSVISSASSRMPTMTVNVAAATTATSTSQANQECIEAYTDCVKGGDVCGSNFEECTNKTLFFAKKAACASTLTQCSAAAITSLFGTSAQTAFANKNTAGEYVYPTDGSVLGQMIEAAQISNRYDTQNCVRRYTSCLKKDDVCGADFELCTSNTEFKKQKLFCESTLARCQDAGLTELFGTTNTAANPTASSRIGIMISEGGALAAVNAVATCYKVIDQCILNTCTTNPYKCKEGSNQEIVNITETINNTDGTTITKTTESILGAVNRSEVSGFIKNNCLDTIGGNKFCYATFIGNGAMPTNAQLRDEDNKDTIYSEAYSSRMNDSMKTKIDELIEKFDKKTKQRCQDTIVNCAMRSCGEGSGAACYASAFNAANTTKGVTNPSTMSDIKYGCEAVVNSDTSCKYAAATFQSTTGLISFLDEGLFDTLFTDPSSVDVTKPDPVGAVATLNAKLATSYNQAALDTMKRQCQTVATGCVKTMCGADYTNCYRNRTDVYSTLTQTDSDSFNKSMNKVGGVLDYTVIIGLCLNTVKTNPVCEEHIKAEAARVKAGGDASNYNSWGGATSTRDGWLGSGVYSATETVGQYQDVDADGNLLCTTAANNGGQIARCDDISGQYIYPYMISESSYMIAQAERTVFRDLVFDLEKEAQAQYNAKLTKQQNMCMSGNNGGIIGTKDLGGTFMWVKLRNNKVPKEYQVNGLQTNQFVASNELYGSFCRIRVTVQSDDKDIQAAIASGKDWGTAYFAAGDVFTCGSWIPNKDLEEISNRIAEKKSGTNADGKLKAGQSWAVAGLSLLGAAGGGLGMNALQEKTGLGGLLGTVKTVDTARAKNLRECITLIDQTMQSLDASQNYDLSEQMIGSSGADAVMCKIYKPVTVTKSTTPTTGTPVTSSATGTSNLRSITGNNLASNASMLGAVGLTSELNTATANSNSSGAGSNNATNSNSNAAVVTPECTASVSCAAGNIVSGTRDCDTATGKWKNTCRATSCVKDTYLKGGQCLTCPDDSTCAGGTAEPVKKPAEKAAEVSTTGKQPNCPHGTYLNTVAGVCKRCPAGATCAGGDTQPVCNLENYSWDPRTETCVTKYTNWADPLWKSGK